MHLQGIEGMWKRIDFSFKCNEENLQGISVFLLKLQTSVERNTSFHSFQEDQDSPHPPVSIIPSWSKGEIQWGAHGTTGWRRRKDWWPGCFLLQQRWRGVDMHIQTDICAPPTPAQALKSVMECSHVMNYRVLWCAQLHDHKQVQTQHLTVEQPSNRDVTED